MWLNHWFFIGKHYQKLFHNTTQNYAFTVIERNRWDNVPSYCWKGNNSFVSSWNSSPLWIPGLWCLKCKLCWFLLIYENTNFIGMTWSLRRKTQQYSHSRAQEDKNEERKSPVLEFVEQHLILPQIGLNTLFTVFFFNLCFSSVNGTNNTSPA